MSKSQIFAVLALTFPVTALADISGTVTLSTGTIFSLDSGKTVSSGGDILWTGTSITFQGNATGANLGPLGSAGFSSLTQSALSMLAGAYSTAPLGSSVLVVNDVFAVHTNAGHYAAVLVTAVGGGSISLQYTTFGATSAPTGPTITGVLNNYSYTLPSLPNYGIAPGALFDVFGSDLANITNIAEQFPLTTTLNGVSLTVTVNGTVTSPPLYFITAGQIAAVLPEATPTGTGTITVTNNGQTSQGFPIVVVQSAFGILTNNGAGTGAAAAFDQNYVALTSTHPAHPGDLIVFWGTGVGPDPANDDKTVPQHADNLTNVPLQAYIGGLPATVYYKGRNTWPGVDTIFVYVPSGVAQGCGVSAVMQSGNILSNYSSIPVAATGSSTCTDTVFGTTGSLPSGKSSYNIGSLSIGQFTDSSNTPPVSNIADAFFENVTGADATASHTPVSIGSCSVITETSSSSSSTPTTTYLDAGAITLAGPNGTVSLQEETFPPATAGPYFGELSSSFLPQSGGMFSFTGAGGKDVGSFTASVNLPALLTWTNESSITSVNRSQGVNVTWSGGTPGTYVVITGNSTGTGANAPTVSFSCYAPVAAGQFTVNQSVLLALPAGKGSLGVYNYSAFTNFTATGLEYGSLYGFVAVAETETYQ